jgi:hypothetical protein
MGTDELLTEAEGRRMAAEWAASVFGRDEDYYPDEREERLEAWIDALDAGLLD